MIKLVGTFVLVGALALTACDSGPNDEPRGEGDHVFATQQHALEAARETGALLEDVAKRKKKQTDEAER